MMSKIKEFATKDVSTFFIRRFSSFTYLNVTQFLGALNDNIYKLLIVYFLVQTLGIENSHRILSVTGAVFVLPFLLFSASSGTLADRFSKRNIIVLTKVFELVIMTAGIFAFWYESIVGPYCILFLLATQSAIFGPSKYGILPELVDNDKITKANGLMTSFTFLAIIIGTFFASFLLDITDRNFIFASIFCASLSVIGLLTSFCIEYTPPAGSLRRFNILFLYETYKTLKISYTVPSLLVAIFGSGFFLFQGAYVQLNMIPYAVQSLHLTDIQGGYLFLLMAIGIGMGSLVAGKISGRVVELGLVPVAGIGITACFYTLDLFTEHFFLIVLLIPLMGLLGGIFLVPLDSYIQITSPKKHRGQIIAATNFLSYFGVLLASFLLFLLTAVFGFDAQKGFTVMGSITLVISIFLIFQFFDYLSRFVAMILSKLHFRTTFNGQEIIPDTPAIFVCSHTAWNDTLLLLGAQRRRMRFFIQQEQDHSKWLKKMYKLLRVVNISSIEPLENNQHCLEEIKETLDKGISVCVFVDNLDISHELDKLCQSYYFKEILKGSDYPMIPVFIDKGKKEKQAKFFKRLWDRIHVPAEISFGSLVYEPEQVPT